jgi:hypothetical protein
MGARAKDVVGLVERSKHIGWFPRDSHADFRRRTFSEISKNFQPGS